MSGGYQVKQIKLSDIDISGQLRPVTIEAMTAMAADIEARGQRYKYTPSPPRWGGEGWGEVGSYTKADQKIDQAVLVFSNLYRPGLVIVVRIMPMISMTWTFSPWQRTLLLSGIICAALGGVSPARAVEPEIVQFKSLDTDHTPIRGLLFRRLGIS